ncbi:MAG: aminomethyltransferase family protein [Gammaproteobacteria bacterium]
MTEALSRTSALAERHRALGSALEDWNGMGTAWSYRTDPDDEHDAVREAAGLFDMSGLKKIYVRGKDAAAAADYLLSRNMAKIAPGQSAYGAVLTERGTVGDDAIIYNNGGGEWLVVHGSGESMERLRECISGKNADAEFNDDLHDISLQGPAALDFLNRHTPLDLPSLPYFHHAQTELFGHPCMLSRTGYSGERGYEIFAAASAVVDIWDNIAEQGKPLGIMPCSFTSLDKARIEAALLFYGYDMTAEHSPWEVGLGWSVSREGNFCGKEAALKLEGRERFKAAGLDIAHDGALAGGETLLANGEKAGIVNSPAWSRRMQKSLALAHVRPDLAAPGTRLTVAGDGAEYGATVAATPFYDPQKTRTHA